MTDTMRWVGSRFTGASAADVEHTVIASSGDLAYMVGFERSHVSVDGGPPRDLVIRVTHIYRRIGGDWKLIRRHADFSLPISELLPPDRPARAQPSHAWRPALLIACGRSAFDVIRPLLVVAAPHLLGMGRACRSHS